MAKWKLTQPHYLKVPGTAWEYTETDRTTGRPKRTQFAVPRFLDPADPSDWTEKEFNNQGQPIDGFVVVTNDPNESKAIFFEGDPTPDMQPLDDDAKEISASFSNKWKHPIESLPADGGYARIIMDGFEKQLAAVQVATAKPVEGVSELLAAMAAVMKQNQELIAALTTNASGGTSNRRV